ncbi:MAG: hypothetical protein NT027_18505, partial [Proteobacteria bacterium]|nr:hypothetical protein [Pseudomonadota bacterium]
MEATIDSVLDKMHVALDQNGDPAKVFELADFAANMVDQTLMTGDTGEAFRLASHSRSQIPASVGADQLPGSVNLKFTPWESRKLYEYSVYILFSAVYSGRSEYIPWLVEALQIAFLGERFAVERVLRTLALPENKVERLVSHWPRKIRELKHLEAVLQGLANLESQHWMLNFLEAAAKDNAFLERARDWKILILTEECRNAGEYSKRLAALLATGEPVLSYGVATVIKRENFFDSDVRLAVVSQLQNPNSSVMTQKFLVEVLKKLSLFGVKVDLDRKYVAAIRSRFRDFEMPILDAFEYNEFANHELSVDISSQQLTVNAHRINAAEWDGKIHCLYQRRVKATAEDALSTDEDEYGLILVDLKSQQSKVFLLPVNFS